MQRVQADNLAGSVVEEAQLVLVLMWLIIKAVSNAAYNIRRL
jgi:hypothetical protein